MKSKTNSFAFGFITGLLLPVISFLIMMLFMSTDLSLFDFINRAVSHHVITKFMSLSVIPNLLLFYAFIWKDLQYSYRGVVGASFVAAIIILLLQLFI